MKALVTGITGFAGSFLAEHLLAEGDAVAGCSGGGAWPACVPASVQRQVPLWTWTLPQRPAAETRRAIEQFAPEVVYHLAAISVPADCGRTVPTEPAWAVNVEGTRAVVDLAGQLPRRPRLLLVSSSWVYARVPADRPWVDERQATEPAGGYATTKLAAENVLLEAVDRQRLDALVARAFQHTGPRQDPRMMLPQWARQLADPAADPVRVLSLDSHIDVSDVRDVVRAYRLLARQGRSGQVYNVGSGVGHRSGDILQRLLQLAGTRRGVVERSAGGGQRPLADFARLHADTGWHPRCPLDQTLADTLRYWQDRFGGQSPAPPPPPPPPDSPPGPKVT